VQRTRSSPSALREPLTRRPLGRFVVRLGLPLVLSSVCRLAVAQGSDYLVVYGAGNAGFWTTELTISSATTDDSTVIISRAPTQICPPLSTCALFVSVPGSGTVVVPTLTDLGTGTGAMFVGTLDSITPPAVLARAYEPSAACASVDLPVFRVQSLLALDPPVLVLPGARRGAAGRSNLVTANVADPKNFDGDPVSLKIEVLSAGGDSLGQTSITLDYGNVLFVSDIVGLLGVAELDDGQVRIQKTGGAGVVWATMPITRADGSLSISLGVTP
jgi:hypothetical protein